jgi:hypothetical protein
MQQSLRRHKCGDSGKTESLRSSVKSTLCSVAKTGQGECGQPGCLRCQAHVLVMEATELGQGYNLARLRRQKVRRRGMRTVRMSRTVR